jgi:hypothetical protein
LKYERKDYDMNIPLSLGFFIVGILAGWSNENSAAAVLFLLMVYFIIKLVQRNKIVLFETLGGIGFLIGFILLIAAPGNYKRLDVIIMMMDSGHASEAFIILLLKRFLYISVLFVKNNGCLVMAVSALFGFDYVYHQKRKLNLFSYFYALATIASVYSMMLSPGFPDRAFMIVLVFSGITLGSIIIQYEIVIPKIVMRNAVILCIPLTIFFSFSILKASRNILGIYLKWEKRIEYIMAEKERGNMDIEVKAPIPVTDKHAALYGLRDIVDDPNDWPNTSIAEYFGLRSIKRLDNDEPWESIWK